MKILIVKLSSIGDIIHALPALVNIRRELPDAEIGWAVDRRYSEILQGNTLIDHLIELDMRSLRGGNNGEEIAPEIGKRFDGLRKHKFDIALDMQGLLKSSTISRLSGAKKRWGFARKDLREPASRLFYTDTVPIEPLTHVVKKNAMLARKALDLRKSDNGFEFPILTNGTHKAEADAFAEIAADEFVILNPAGGWLTKLWPAENYGRLADVIYERLGLASIVAVGPNDGLLAETVLANSSSGRTSIAKPSLKGFYELARLASGYVGGDTGPTHIAVAAGTPVVGIFGPTEWWRNGSTNAADICVERNDIGCRVECHRRTCSNWICMEISVETVFEAVERRLEPKRTEVKKKGEGHLNFGIGK